MDLQKQLELAEEWESKGFRSEFAELCRRCLRAEEVCERVAFVYRGPYAEGQEPDFVRAAREVVEAGKQ